MALAEHTTIFVTANSQTIEHRLGCITYPVRYLFTLSRPSKCLPLTLQGPASHSPTAERLFLMNIKLMIIKKMPKDVSERIRNVTWLDVA